MGDKDRRWGDVEKKPVINMKFEILYNRSPFSRREGDEVKKYIP